jgi:hypothetical protein
MSLCGMMYIVMIIKAKYFSGYYDFLHVVSRGNDSVVVISPDRKRCRTPVVELVVKLII